MSSRYTYGGPPLVRQHEQFVRNSRTVGVLWAVFSVCLAILCCLVFVLPNWMGDNNQVLPDVSFGLYQYCPVLSSQSQTQCIGDLTQFESIVSGPFQVATVLSGAAAVLSLLGVMALLLFLCAGSRTVYCLCSWIQLFVFVCISAACIVYPFGWNSGTVKQYCGSAADAYSLGECSIQWTYVLAIIAAVDAFLLCILGFTLALKQVKLEHSLVYPSSTGQPTYPDYMGRQGDRRTGGPIITPLDEADLSRPSYSRNRTLQL